MTLIFNEASSISVLINDVQPDIDWNEVIDRLMSIECICQVEDLHIWSLSHSVVELSTQIAYEPGVVGGIGFGADLGFLPEAGNTSYDYTVVIGERCGRDGE